jgi:hypothetical protein
MSAPCTAAAGDGIGRQYGVHPLVDSLLRLLTSSTVCKALLCKSWVFLLRTAQGRDIVMDDCGYSGRLRKRKRACGDGWVQAIILLARLA